MNTKKKLLLTAFLCLLCGGALVVFLPPSALSRPVLSPNRLLMALAVLCFLAGALCLVWLNPSRKKALLAVALTALLTFTYMTNAFDPANVYYDNFQADSDVLVYSRALADSRGYREYPYGLCFYTDLKGDVYPDFRLYQQKELISRDDLFVYAGFSGEFPGIVVNANGYTESVLVPGNTLTFQNGDRFRILEVQKGDLGLYVTLDAPALLSPDIQGDLMEMTIQDASGNSLPQGGLTEYVPQVGLHGFAATVLVRLFGQGALHLLSPICALLFALSVVWAAFLMEKRFGRMFAGCFLTVFWLSPWVVNFAKSTYWVEFTWMLPAVCGLSLSLHREDARKRRLGYLMAFCTILLKSLCGYEYMTFVMMGTILPLLMDLLDSLLEKNGKQVKKLFVTIFCTGICAVAGFLAAMLLHAGIRGEGDLLAGFRAILFEDAFRRTVDIDISFLTIFKQYFRFNTHILPGVEGSLFPVLAVLPGLLFIWNYMVKGTFDKKDAGMYVLSFLTSLSWLFFAQQHSHEHGHMNFVCWYYWFIPVCLYLIVKQVHGYVSGRKDVSEA